MVVVTSLLLALLVLEGAVLVLWPARVKSILAGSSPETLRVVGVAELVFVIAMLFWVLSYR